MGYSGFQEEYLTAWKKAFIKKYERKPTADEAFEAGFKLCAFENQGYNPETAIKEYLES